MISTKTMHFSVLSYFFESENVNSSDAFLSERFD